MDKLDKAQRLGLLGGTFDPIHNAHIEIALIAKQQHNLDAVHFIVAKDPPTKDQVVLDAEKRFDLVSKALAAYEDLEASRVELDRSGKSYSYLTVQDYKKRFPDAELFWIMGEDAFDSLPEWKNFDYLKENLRFIVFNRTDSDLSSTQLRKEIEQSNPELKVPINIREKVLEYYRKD